MVEAVASAAGGLDIDREVLFRLILADIIGQLARAQGKLKVGILGREIGVTMRFSVSISIDPSPFSHYIFFEIRRRACFISSSDESDWSSLPTAEAASVFV